VKEQTGTWSLFGARRLTILARHGACDRMRRNSPSDSWAKKVPPSSFALRHSCTNRNLNRTAGQCYLPRNVSTAISGWPDTCC